jgi:hypothetical protein
MITAKKVRVEIQKTEASVYTGASGSIQVSDEEQGSVVLNVDNGPSVSVELPDLMEALAEAIARRK